MRLDTLSDVGRCPVLHPPYLASGFLMQGKVDHGKRLRYGWGGAPSTIFVGKPSGEKLAGFELVTWSTATAMIGLGGSLIHAHTVS